MPTGVEGKATEELLQTLRAHDAAEVDLLDAYRSVAEEDPDNGVRIRADAGRVSSLFEGAGASRRNSARGRFAQTSVVGRECPVKRHPGRPLISTTGRGSVPARCCLALER